MLARGERMRPDSKEGLRTPMAWQHRDQNYLNNHSDRGDTFDSSRYGGDSSGPDGGRMRNQTSPSRSRYGPPTPGGGGSSRYGGPPTPNSAHSRMTRTPDHRRDTRGSSSDRYSQQSTRKLVRETRSQGGSSRGVGGGSRSTSHRGFSRSHPSPSSTEETAEETTETDSQAPNDFNISVPMYHPGFAYPIGYPPGPTAAQFVGPIAPPQLFMAPNGSIRSVQSVPLLTAAPLSHTWDGEPCPVHHHQTAAMPLAALYGMGHPALSMGPSSVPPSIISGATTVRRARSVAEISNSGYPIHAGYPASAPGTPHIDSKSFHGSMHFAPMTNGTMGHPGMRPPTRMVLGENGTPSHLPTRDPKLGRMSHKDLGKDNKGLACCSGHFVVIWIILGIVTFGVLLGIVLKFTVA